MIAAFCYLSGTDLLRIDHHIWIIVFQATSGTRNWACWHYPFSINTSLFYIDLMLHPDPMLDSNNNQTTCWGTLKLVIVSRFAIYDPISLLFV